MKLQFLVAIFFLAFMQLFESQSLPGCQSSCGSVKIDYPFGISPSCYLDEYPGFNLTCEKDKLLFGNITVINISHIDELRVRLPRSHTCYNSQGGVTDESGIDFSLGNLTISDKNKFITVGCNTIAILRTFENGVHTSAGVSVCDSDSPPKAKDKCSGRGCSQNIVPRGSNFIRVEAFRIDEDDTDVQNFSPCSYAFLVEDGKFEFNPLEDLKNLRNVTDFPVVLDWSIGNQTCKQAGSTRICGKKSTCIDSATRNGYNCKCFEGFEGNPYLPNGCQDINECTSSRHNCSDPKTCRNSVGGFDCQCSSGYHLNTTTMSCANIDMAKKEKPKYLWTTILLGTTIGLLVILLVVICLKQRMKHQKASELRKKFFEQNGGSLLIQRVSGAGPSNVNVNIFTEEGIKEATNGYDASRILGQGGQGTVYKGVLPDNSVVAIKKARLGDRSQVEQFINELLVLSQVNHRNVVKLLGCCLETEVPLLVYEFINSGTLSDHLHGSLFDSSLTWEHRLRISIEVAGTLAYLHSSASIPIIHRDIKSANILLDDNLTAKVADFGTSRQIPMDKDQITTIVKGTFGYLDPEYHNTGLLNEKSDVYSYGVVHMELLSGKKAVCFERPQTSKHLASYFGSAMKEKRLHEVIDGQVMNEDNQREIQEAAKIALKCTRQVGEQRPRMKEVAAELEALRAHTIKRKWSDKYPEDLLGGRGFSAQGDTSSRDYDSIQKELSLEIEAAP